MVHIADCFAVLTSNQQIVFAGQEDQGLPGEDENSSLDRTRLQGALRVCEMRQGLEVVVVKASLFWRAS